MVRSSHQQKKLLDTPQHKLLRLEWVLKHHTKTTDQFILLAYMVEKRLYTTNRRRKIKRLPRGPFEEVIQPKIRHCRFNVKLIFLGVVVHPCLHRIFDRRILLERVSKHHVITKLTSHTNFSNDAHTYEPIWSGKWMQYFDQSSPLSPNEILEAVIMQYSLDQEITDVL